MLNANNFVIELLEYSYYKQVGAICKVQKYSKNNYWQHLEKLFFFKKIFLKIFFSNFFLKVVQCRKTQKEAIQAH